MPTPPLLSANEAAVVTRVPLKQVHRIIDAGLLAAGKGKRMVASSELPALRLAFLTAKTLTPAARRRIVGRALSKGGATDIQDTVISIPMEPIAMAVRNGLDALARARGAVSIDPEIMGGEPCLSGTRIPVHLISDLIAGGDGVEAIMGAYPQLSAEQIYSARLYAQAYPRRGRPPARSPDWINKARVTRRVIRLQDLPVE